MGTITSSVGLVSGIDTGSLIDQLIAIDSKPLQQVQTRVATLQSQKTAFLDINSRVLALGTSASTIGDISLFKSKLATSSNEGVLTATASNSASPGTYSFTVDRLVSTQQLITSGFADTDTSPVGAGTLTFESAQAKLTSDAKLADLNGGAGVPRGTIRITDRSGASAQIDLTKAVSINDVLDAINSTTNINVTASLEGDHLKLTDNTGSTTNNLTVADVGSSTTAASLGLAGDGGGTSAITGSQINKITSSTTLSALNDGNGVRVRGSSLPDFSVDLNGTSFNVSLENARTIGDVVDAINNASSNPGVTASIAADGASLQLTGTGTITVSALNSSHAAADLGIEGTASNTLGGTRLIASLGSKLLRNLNGGSGVATPGTISITNRAGTVTSVDLSAAQSVQEVIDTINNAGAGVTASLNSAGNGLKITDTTGSTASNLIIADGSGSSAADLGIATDPAGVASNSVTGTDLNFRYINENTRLDSLNGGKGITPGKFRITDSAGVSAVVDLTQGNEKTLQDVISEINSRPTGIVATINSTGDGLLLTDTAGGAVHAKVEEDGSTTAADLGILGEDTNGTGQIDGSFAKSVTIAAGDTLDAVVTKINAAGVNASASIINDGTGANPYRLSITANNSGAAGQIILDDHGLGLNATTLVKGQDAVVLYGSADPTQALLLTSSTNTLNNTIKGVTVDLNGTSTGPVQVSVSNDNSGITSAVSDFVKNFNNVLDTIDKYDTYNADTNTQGLLLGDGTVRQIRSRLNNIVLGQFANNGGQYSYLTQIGITFDANARLSLDQDKFNAALAADPESVKDLFTATTTSAASTTSNSNLPTGVTIPANTASSILSVGFGKKLIDLTNGLTDSVSGLITGATNSIDSQVTLGNQRIDELNKLLANERTRLQNQFNAMETALAQLQSQQNSINSIASSTASVAAAANATKSSSTSSTTKTG